MSTEGGVPMRIDFVSDIACPWCAVGLASLEQALERIGGDIRAEIHFQPFELNPHMAPEGEDTAEHIKNKYGLDDAQLAENQARIRERGAELGFTFHPEGRRRIVNTFDAHRLLHWAGIEGRQSELKHALLRAYFTDRQDVSDHDTLLRIASEVGLPGDQARDILASDRYAAEVRAAEELFQRSGINAVPSVILNRRHLVSGGQPVEVFERALREVAAGEIE
ncbi:DsbA family oxidoreductase [Luteimonas vadosa]|uniref:DsbA family oxidoreductase n=1 Tax=Luteimonas vadosa TaxID=1165507 RepID=A0ABP9E515_9GAMM